MNIKLDKAQFKMKARDAIKFLRHGIEKYSWEAKCKIDNLTSKLHHLEHKLVK